MSKPAASLYTRYVKLCNGWSTDVTKRNRDLGEHLRKVLSTDFPSGEFTQLPSRAYEKKERELTSLEKLANNVYWKPLAAKQASASGATLAECSVAISTEALEVSKQIDEASFITKLKLKLDSVGFRKTDK